MKWIDETNINKAKLFLFELYSTYTLKSLWNKYDQNNIKYHGLEIPLELNWHNGKSFNDPKNYFKINLIAINLYNYTYANSFMRSYSLTDLKEKEYLYLLKDIGKLIYNQTSIENNDIILFKYQDRRMLRTFKTNTESKHLKEYVIIGVKMLQYEKFPYNNFINVIGPKESFFVDI